MAEEYRHLRVESPEDGVVLATLARPERRNALNEDLFDDLQRLQDALEVDPSVRALVITGEGAGFCAGLDLELAATLPDVPATTYLRRQERWARAVAGFHRLSVPVIAAVNGAAAGAGLSLALAADIRIASTTARFNAAFVRIGLSAGDLGTSWLLPRIVGSGRSTEILLTGRFVDAAEAERIGLVTDVVAAEDLLARALEIAATITANSPFGMRMTKQIVGDNLAAVGLDAAIALENRTQTLAIGTADFAEALAAFRERRTPRFEDR